MTTDLGRISRAVLLTLPVTVFACSKGSTGLEQPVLASIDVTPASQTLVSLGETLQMTAAGRSSSGSPVSAQFTWSSSSQSVVTVSTTGVVTAVSDGSANIIATSGSITGMAAITVAQAPASVAAYRGNEQGGAAGEPLDSVVSVVVLDALGSPVADVDVEFAPTAGSGSVDPTGGTSDGQGLLSVEWTLGQTSGGQSVIASLAADPSVQLQINANAFAGDPVLIELLDGDGQIELASTVLPAPIRVRTLDQFGNGVPDVPVNFAAPNGSVDQSQVFTDAEGTASVSWTLGAGLGAYTATASVPDSVLADADSLPIVDLPGSPVTFMADAVAYDVAAVTPDPPVVGDTITIQGMGFDPDPVANTVTVDGVAALVVGGTQTSLDVVVPSYGCVPVADRWFAVARGAESDSVQAQVEPEDALRLGVGGRIVLDDPDDYCLQFLPGSDEEYLVGLTSTRRLAGEMSFSLVGYDGVNPPPAPPAPVAAATSGGSTQPFEGSPELRLRAWEERFLATGVEGLGAGPVAASSASESVSAGTSSPVSAPLAVPDPGDVLPFRVPTITADPCNDYTAITAQVLAVGSRVVVALDQQVVAGPLIIAGISAALNTMMALFGDQIWALGTQYFGLPSDLDANQRITVVLSPEVRAQGVPAITTAVDHLPRTTCPSSDEGEIIYLAIQEAPTLAVFTERLTNAPPDLAHHFTHIVQHARRLALGGGALPLLLGEGQAETAVEIIGMSIRGEASRLDYGAGVMNGDLLGLWYRPRFDRLSYLFGWDGATGTRPGAPETCSLFGFGGLQVACDPEYAPGMAWGFLRYVTDRFGAAFPGGDEALHQALVDASPDGDVLAALEALVGEAFADVMVEWAMTLYADGRIGAGSSPDLQFQSWNLEDVYGSLPVEQQLHPPSHAFASFTQASGVVGGGTTYSLISTGLAHGPLAVRARDPLDGILSVTMEPRLWVVRIR